MQRVELTEMPIHRAMATLWGLPYGQFAFKLLLPHAQALPAIPAASGKASLQPQSLQISTANHC